MKLTPTLVDRTLVQFKAAALPEDHSSRPGLASVFGDHTFLRNDDGLHIVEPVEPSDTGEAIGQVVKLASWQDADHTSLAPHKPEPTDIIVMLAAAA